MLDIMYRDTSRMVESKLSINILLPVYLLTSCYAIQATEAKHYVKSASCRVLSDPTKDVEEITGLVTFKQRYLQPLKVNVTLFGNGHPFLVKGRHRRFHHGFHVHALRTSSNKCDASGADFNPGKSFHGGRNGIISHDGDFGNIHHISNTGFRHRFTLFNTTLYGRNSIIGKTLVIHHNRDDAGHGNNFQSKIDGNSGEGIACCIIKKD